MNDVVCQGLMALDWMAREWELSIDEQDRYRSVLQSMQAGKDSIRVSGAQRSNIVHWLEILTGRSCTYLDGKESLKQLLSLLGQVGYTQWNDCVLVKYHNLDSMAYWCPYTLHARGKVIHIASKEIRSYPFDKFFALDEVSVSSSARVEEVIQRGATLEVTEKLDGSCMAVTRRADGFYIHTGGGFDNKQCRLTKELLEQKYPELLEHMPQGYTAVMELVHPENVHVIDYGEEKALYLLAVRELQHGELLEVEQLKVWATEYGLPLPKVYQADKLEQLRDWQTEPAYQHLEGWVVTVKEPSGTWLVKVKTKVYERHAHELAYYTKKTVYQLYKERQDESVLADLSGAVYRQVLTHLTEIKNQVKVLETRVNYECQKVLGDGKGADLERVAREYDSSPLKPYILKQLRQPDGKLEQHLPSYRNFEELLNWIVEKGNR